MNKILSCASILTKTKQKKCGSVKLHHRWQLWPRFTHFYKVARIWFLCTFVITVEQISFILWVNYLMISYFFWKKRVLALMALFNKQSFIYPSFVRWYFWARYILFLILLLTSCSLLEHILVQFPSNKNENKEKYSFVTDLLIKYCTYTLYIQWENSCMDWCIDWKWWWILIMKTGRKIFQLYPSLNKYASI